MSYVQSSIKAYSLTVQSDKSPFKPSPGDLLPEEFDNPEELEEFGACFRNSYKCLRVARVRKYLWENFDIEKICRAYGEWVDTDEWLQLNHKVRFVDGTTRSELVFVPCVKRGNDGYQARVNKRISDMGDFEEWPFDIPGGRNNLQTRVLFVTLSQDAKRFEKVHKHPQQKAWEEIGKEFNGFCSNIRQRFGKFALFRVFESTDKGFPHVHAILVFEEKKFRGFMHKGMGKRFKMRIREKNLFEAAWHSHVDVRGVVRFKRGMAELLKYLKKDIGYKQRKNGKAFLNSPKGRKTLALTWFFNKRAFAVSGFFRDLTTALHNSNMIAKIPRFFQSDLMNRKVASEEWSLVDIVPWKIVAELGGVG